MPNLVLAFSKIIPFLMRYRKHPLYVIIFLWGYCLRKFTFSIHFYSNEELLFQLEKGKSLIRFGDGDMVSIPLDLENCYHTSDQKLKDMYATIINDYRDDSPYVLSVPIFVNTRNTELKKMGPGKLRWGVSMKTMFFLRFNKKTAYMDAHNFYYDNFFEGIIAPVFKGKQVIFLTNKKTIEKQKNNQKLPWENPLFVETPFVNAMNAYEDIKKDLNEKIASLAKKDIVIFAAMGPVGKYIIYEYAQRGYQGIDIGKVCEVMYTGESIQYMI